MNLSGRVVYFAAHDEELCCCLFMYRASLLSVGKKISGFLKNVEKTFGKNMFF